MPRISGVEIPETKRADIALTHIFGIGRKNVCLVLAEAGVERSKKIENLTEDEVSRLQRSIDKTLKVEGDLRKEVTENIKRLKQINSYRGRRHSAGLPVRGQRTRSNARTKRGRRITIGALKKQDLAKKQQAEAVKAKTK